MTYEPVSLLTVDRTVPVSVWVAVMSAPGKTAPLASLTVPLICAVACAQALTQPRTTISNTMAEYFARHFIDSSPDGSVVLRNSGASLYTRKIQINFWAGPSSAQ